MGVRSFKMIVGTGIDIVEIGRIEAIHKKYENRFLLKILTPNELKYLPVHPTSYIAGRWAAKEAAVKALGTGFNHGISFLDMEILPSPSGKPELFFFRKAAQMASWLNVKYNYLSISHERTNAIAIVILEK